MDDQNVTTEQALEMIRADTNIVLLDVRTPEEYAGELGHLKNSILIPVQELESRMPEIEQYRDKKILAYCRTGRRSRTAMNLLRGKGFDALNVQGGMVEWNKLQLPHVETGK
ncbi:MAG TPA: rhodanese-like domain-containing protein [Bacteroidota bacterium]|nr:rhodanese-like domain-containing protein [Bacteroidota bacterium]